MMAICTDRNDGKNADKNISPDDDGAHSLSASTRSN